MRNLKWKWILYALVIIFFYSNNESYAQIIIWEEDFEDHGNTANGGSGRYTSSSDFFGASSDYWGRIHSSEDFYLNGSTMGNNIHIISGGYIGQNGSFYYAAEDVNDAGPIEGTQDGNTYKEITFSTFSINGATNMQFRGLFARGETDGCTMSTYDDNDFVEIFYNIDGSGEVRALCFNPDLECNIPNDISNEPLHHDPNCDGDGGEGTLLTNTFQEFTFNIPGIGNTLDLRIRLSMDAASEEFALDYFRVYSDTAVPIKLGSFEAKPNGDTIDLLWTTLSETNNDFFEIQKRNDAISFVTVGKVTGAGISNEFLRYAHTDKSPSPGMNYYRLKQVDYNGGFEFSPTVAVNYKSANQEILLYPNPVSDILTIAHPDASEAPSIKIYDLSGRQLYVMQLKRDTEKTELDLDFIGKGLYILSVNTEGRKFVKRFVKY